MIVWVFAATSLLIATLFVIIVMTEQRQRLELIDATDEELLLLGLIDDEELKLDLLTYLRTLKMTVRLQQHMAGDPDLLQGISSYMILQAARGEQRKREEWEPPVETQVRQPSFNDERIMRSLKRFQ